MNQRLVESLQQAALVNKQLHYQISMPLSSYPLQQHFHYGNNIMAFNTTTIALRKLLHSPLLFITAVFLVLGNIPTFFTYVLLTIVADV